MSETTFKNFKALAVGTSPTTAYTAPSSTVAILIGMTVANISDSQISVTVTCGGATLVKNAPVPANSSLSVLDGKIVLTASEPVVITSDTASSVDAIISLMEQV